MWKILIVLSQIISNGKFGICDLQINYKSYGNNKNSLMMNTAFFTLCNLKFFSLRKIREGAVWDIT
jgi:hypothetical protein